MQEYTHRLATRQHVRHELAGQRLGTQKRHEDPRGFGRFRIGRDTDGAALAHFLDHTEDALLGRGRNAIAQLHALLAQQFVHGLELGRTVENDRFALAAIEVIEHFPVAQVAGDAHHALARGECVLEDFQAFDFAHQRNRPLGRPDPGAGAFGQGFADIHQALPDQTLASHRIELGETLGQVDAHNLPGTVGQFPHQPTNRRTYRLHGPPRQQGKQSQCSHEHGAFKLIHRSLLSLSESSADYCNRGFASCA